LRSSCVLSLWPNPESLGSHLRLSFSRNTMLYVNLPVGSAHGWGICGKYVARELSKLTSVGLITEPFSEGSIGDAFEFHELRRLWMPDAMEGVSPTSDVQVLDGPLLQGIGNERLIPRSPHIRGKHNVGYTFFENNILDAGCIENGRLFFDHISAGSTWCTNVLREAGFRATSTIFQGVDTSIFCPASRPTEKREFLADRFVVFSGGKFELRKAQDVVIRAYKVLQDKHSDALLVNAWFNPWPKLLETMRDSALIRYTSAVGSYSEFVSRMLAENGIDCRRVITCPRTPNQAMARIYRNTDVGIFPNRCEGGTNLVLMEYMACGKPTIATSTTGQADIVNSGNALPIGVKGDRMVYRNGIPVACWPEPDLDDTIEKLEWAYQNPGKLAAIGEEAGREMSHWTWHKTAKVLLELGRCNPTPGVPSKRNPTG
jgi:glycosyltransferase involved in cell wall biosynthesis